MVDQLAPGAMIDRYQLLNELGRGGMAQVYRALDTRMQREVAVKLLPREYLHDANFKARFEREAQTIAGLEHPAVVPIHDYGEFDGQPYLVMRYMAGGSLAERIRSGRMPLSDIATVLYRIATALDYAHSCGVVHRDLKPANVMFDDAGHAYLSDFGIARLADATVTLTKTGVFIGTPAYMSPEQIQGDQELDGRSDVYALGIILFEMLSGEQPYSADTPAKTMMKHVLDPIPQLRDLDQDLLPGANRLVAQALAKSRDERFHSASELASEFAALAAVPVAEAVASAAAPANGTAPRTAAFGRDGGLWSWLPAVPAWTWLALGVLALGTIGTGSALALGAIGRQPADPEAPAIVVTAPPSRTPTASATPTPLPSATPEPSPTTGSVWAAIEQDAVCRAGPGTAYDILGYLSAGQAALTFGVDPAGEWWWIQYPSGTLSCWVSGLLVSFQDGPPVLPALTAAPTNTPTPRSTEAPQQPSGPNPTASNTPVPPSPTITPWPTSTPCDYPAYSPPGKTFRLIPETPCP